VRVTFNMRDVNRTSGFRFARIGAAPA
jgi:hypothetical protein